MRDDLLLYYERELTFLREMGAEFAQKYPKIASRLVLETDKCEDPHVERMLEAFAFLSARVHLKIDDDFPEITEALLNILYPHYMRPIPSMSIVEFQVDSEQVNPETGFKIERGSGAQFPSRRAARRASSVPAATPRSGRVSVAAAEWTTADRLQPAIKAADAAAAIRLELKCAGDMTFAKLAHALAAVLPERREQPHPRALRAAVQQLRAHRDSRSVAQIARSQPVMLDAGALAAGGFRGKRGHAALPAALVRRATGC